jgi:hypothetical protein
MYKCCKFSMNKKTATQEIPYGFRSWYVWYVLSKFAKIIIFWKCLLLQGKWSRGWDGFPSKILSFTSAAIVQVCPSWQIVCWTPIIFCQSWRNYDFISFYCEKCSFLCEKNQTPVCLGFISSPFILSDEFVFCEHFLPAMLHYWPESRALFSKSAVMNFSPACAVATLHLRLNFGKDCIYHKPTMQHLEQRIMSMRSQLKMEAPQCGKC